MKALTETALCLRPSM